MDKEDEICTFEEEPYWMYLVCVYFLWLIHVFNNSFFFFPIRFECQKLVLVGDPKVSRLNNLFYGDHRGRHPSLYPTFPLEVLQVASLLFDSPLNH